jgi:hypothetical protein
VWGEGWGEGENREWMNPCITNVERVLPGHVTCAVDKLPQRPSYGGVCAAEGLVDSSFGASIRLAALSLTSIALLAG